MAARHGMVVWFSLVTWLAATAGAATAGSAGLHSLQEHPPPGRPAHNDTARLARWLVHHNLWGVLSTSSVEFGGLPFGNMLSVSDGAPGQSSGRMLFYLAEQDSAVTDMMANSSATFTVAEAQIPGSCRSEKDVEDPVCARVVALGHVGPVPEEGQATAQEMVFARHPAMRDWHAHAFRAYEFVPEKLRLLSYYGGYAYVQPEEYYAAELDYSPIHTTTSTAAVED